MSVTMVEPGARFLVGTSGWSYPHWQGTFYPPDLRSRDWLGYYSRHFATVEVNASFYRMPSEKAFRNWKVTVPEDFCYAVKGHRYVTHLKKLQGVEEHLGRFFERVRLLGKKLGPILFQLPPRWNCNPARLRGFLLELPSDLRFAIEFRNRTWLNEEIYAALEERGVAFCIISMPDFPCPVRATASFVYIRFHGAKVVYGGRYREIELSWWAEQIAGFLAGGRDVYAYFNNDAFAYAVENALMLDRINRMAAGNVPDALR